MLHCDQNITLDTSTITRKCKKNYSGLCEKIAVNKEILFLPLSSRYRATGTIFDINSSKKAYFLICRKFCVANRNFHPSF